MIYSCTPTARRILGGWQAEIDSFGARLVAVNYPPPAPDLFIIPVVFQGQRLALVSIDGQAVFQTAAEYEAYSPKDLFPPLDFGPPFIDHRSHFGPGHAAPNPNTSAE